MRWFLSGRVPPPERILLVESGSRHLLERAAAEMSRHFPEARFDLCTCFPGAPAAPAVDRVWRVNEARSLGAKLSMAGSIVRARPPIAALLFSGEPVMLNWKLLLLLALPSKIIVVNEHGDFFWLDRKHLTVVRTFLGARMGVGGDAFLRAIFQILVFPIVFLYLVCYTLVTYLARWTRLLLWRLTGAGHALR
jgi:hypothetical protein